jgi:glutaredoxin
VINEHTPYKAAEIIRDTWPGIFRPPLDKSLNTYYDTPEAIEVIMDITIYTTVGCGYCVKVKELMRRAGIQNYTEVNIPRDILKEDFKIKFPFATGYPFVVIDGEEIGGLVETVKYFVEKGLVTSKK